MPTLFAHAISGLAISQLGAGKKWTYSIGITAMLLAAFPDADVLGFNWGVPYGSLWGHRGMTHSLFFGILFGGLIAFVYKLLRPKEKISFFKIALIFIISISSHGVLDAMTTGGKGIAFFAPFDEGRYFLPWRFIKVSPMSISRFFSDWGLQVLQSEFIYIWIPSLIIMSINNRLLKTSA